MTARVSKEEVRRSVGVWLDNNEWAYKLVRGQLLKGIALKKTDPVKFALERSWYEIRDCVTFEGITVRKYAVREWLLAELDEIKFAQSK